MRFVSSMVAVLALALAGASCALVAGLSGDATLLQPDAGTGGAAGPVICAPGDTMTCYDGPKGTEGVAACHGGIAACNAQGTEYGACMGEVTPQPPTCATTVDVACLGHDNCVQWAELFGNAQGSYADGIALDAAGNSYVVGSFSGSIELPGMSLTAAGTSDAFLLKLDPSGTPVWGRSFGASGSHTIGTAVAVDTTGHVAIGGYTNDIIHFDDTHSVGPGLYVARLDAGNNQIIWAKGLTVNYTLPSFDWIYALACTSQGDVVVGGHFTSDLDFGDGPITGSNTVNPIYAFLGKLGALDGSGKMPGGWGRALCSGTSSCNVYSVVAAADDTLLVAGTFDGSMTLGPGYTLSAQGMVDGFIGTLDSTGSVLRHQQIGGSSAGAGFTSLAIAPDDGPILSGSFSGTVELSPGVMITAPNSGYYFVVHYGPDQSYRWHMVLPNGSVTNVAADPAGDIVLAGTFNGPLSFGGSMVPLMATGMGNFFVAKLSSADALLWAKSYGDGTWLPSFTGLVVTPQGAPILVGDALGAIELGAFSLMPVGKNEAFVMDLSP